MTEIHPMFTTWMHSLDAAITEDTVTKAWEVVQELQSLKIATLPDLLYLIYNVPKLSKEAIVEAVQSVDSTFPLHGKEQALRVYALAAVMETLRRKSQNCEFLSYGLISLDFLGFESIVEETAVSGRNLIRETAIASRQLSSAVLYKLKADLDKQRAQVKSISVEGAGTATEFQTLDKYLKLQNSTILKALTELEKDNKIVAEESNVMWWLLSGYSPTLSKFLSDAPIYARCMGAAWDLAEMQKFNQTMPNAQAILAKAIGNDANQCNTLVAAVEEFTTNNTLENIDADVTQAKLIPIISACSMVQELGNGNWITKWERLTGTDAKVEHTAAGFGSQLLNELMLLRNY